LEKYLLLVPKFLIIIIKSNSEVFSLSDLNYRPAENFKNFKKPTAEVKI